MLFRTARLTLMCILEGLSINKASESVLWLLRGVLGTISLHLFFARRPSVVRFSCTYPEEVRILCT